MSRKQRPGQNRTRQPALQQVAQEVTQGPAGSVEEGVPQPVGGRDAGADRLALVPGLACLTRDEQALQLGVEPPHAVVVHGASEAYARIVRVMDGRHDRAELGALARAVGLTAGELDELLDLLTRHGLLAPTGGQRARLGLDTDELARLSPDLVALALRHTNSSNGGLATARSLVARRAAAWVEVHGAGRVGAGIAALLAAAGIGRVSIVDTARCDPADVAPLGLHRGAVGSGREAAAKDRVSDVSRSTCTSPAPTGRPPNLCVLAPDAGPSATLGADWARRTEPHLLAYVRETAGVVGPLVLPGLTACLRCLDLHRRDYDPGWPRIAAQLGGHVSRRACDVSLATLVAAQCSLQALAFLDGDPVSALGATLETTDNGAGLRRRAWTAHPACGCGWAAATEPPQRLTGSDPAGWAVRARGP